MFNPLPVVFAELRRGWVGVLAVVLLIGVAVALGVAVSAQERALRKGSARAADRFDLVVGAPGSATQLVLTTVYLQPAALPLVPGAVLRWLAADPGVAMVAPVAFGDFHKGHPVVGTTARFVSENGAGVLAEGRVFARMTEVVVGADVPFPLGYRFKPTHGQGHAAEDEGEDEGEDGGQDDGHGHVLGPVHEELEYVVVGRMAARGTPWDRAILAPVESVWWVHGLPTGHRAAAAAVPDPAQAVIGDDFDADRLAGVPAIVVKPKSVGDAYRLRGLLRSALHGGATMAVFPAEVLVDLYATLGDARDLLAVIATATQVLVVGAVLLAVFATLANRRRPLAVLRALGASRGYIFTTVWLHVTLMVLAGAVLGLFLGWGGAHALSAVFAVRTGIALPVTLTGKEIGMAAFLVMAGGMLAVIPATVVYRRPVTAALRL